MKNTPYMWCISIGLNHNVGKLRNHLKDSERVQSCMFHFGPLLKPHNLAWTLLRLGFLHWNDLHEMGKAQL